MVDSFLFHKCLCSNSSTKSREKEKEKVAGRCKEKIGGYVEGVESNTTASRLSIDPHCSTGPWRSTASLPKGNILFKAILAGGTAPG